MFNSRFYSWPVHGWLLTVDNQQYSVHHQNLDDQNSDYLNFEGQLFWVVEYLNPQLLDYVQQKIWMLWKKYLNI